MMTAKDVAREGRARQEAYYQQQRKALRDRLPELKKASIKQEKE